MLFEQVVRSKPAVSDPEAVALDAVELSPDEEVLDYVLVNHPCFLESQPPSKEVLLLEYLDEDGNQLDLLLAVLFPLVDVGLVYLVVLGLELFGPFGSRFSSFKVVPHSLV